MSRMGLSLAVLLLAGFATSALAQPGIERFGFGRERSNMPVVGSVLPGVTVYDEQGNEFSTESLRGHYSVLVFGCLT